jgi:hypothetical protein
VKSLRVFFLFSLIVFAFQNCGTFEAANQFQYYSYKSSPLFYFDFKLVEKSMDDLGRQKFVFDVVISYALDLNQSASYSVNFSTKMIPGVCSAATGSAISNSKHFRTECLIPTPDDLYVQLMLSGPNGESLTQSYRF